MTVLRVVAGAGALLFTAPALLVLFNQIRYGVDPLGVIFGAAIAMPAVLCWWFALRGHRPESRASLGYALGGGLILGGVSFAAGFFGPLILTPEANQGPLLGIFITGPIGFVIGVALGALYARFRVRSAGQRIRWQAVAAGLVLAACCWPWLSSSTVPRSHMIDGWANSLMALWSRARPQWSLPTRS